MKLDALGSVYFTFRKGKKILYVYIRFVFQF